MGNGLCGRKPKVHPEPKPKTGKPGGKKPKDPKKVKHSTTVENYPEKLAVKHDRKPPSDLGSEYDYVLDRKLIKDIKRKYRSRKKHRSEVEEEKMGEEERKRHQIMNIFELFDKWDFDIHRLSKLTDGYPLVYVAYAFLIKRDLFKKFNIDEELFFKFMEKIQSLYNNTNVFYNCTRAASILQSFNFLLRKGLGEFVSETDLLASCVACSIIYVGHPGLDNHYVNNAESRVSTVYNDIATLENVACYMWMKKIYQLDSINMLRALSKKQKKEVREIVIDMVIATDMDRHKYYLSQFSSRVENNSDFSSKEDINLLLQMSLIFCSLDYMAKNQSCYLKWVEKLLVQAFAQGDVEKKEKLPVRSICDRAKNGNKKLGKEQVKLIDTYMKPILRPLFHVFTKLKAAKLKPQVRRNKDYWNTTYKREENRDFNDIHKSTLSGLKEQYDLLVKVFCSYPVEKNQARNVSWEKQVALMPKPTEIDARIHQTCMDKLEERWSASNTDRKPFTEMPKIFAIVDYKKHPKPSEDDRVYSIVNMFDRIDEYHFDCFTLEKLLNDDCLILVTYTLFVKNDFLTKFKISKDVLLKFLATVQKGYQRNPYHNGLHATDVMQVTNCICKKGGVVEKMSDVDVMGSLLASVVHDLDHPGLNDAFQVNASSYLAILYNDRSVLEMHHCAEMFRLMRVENMDIFQNMTPEQRRDCRKTIVDMIVSTDMSNHAKYVKTFNKLIEEESTFTKKRDIRIALQIVIKMADVSNPSRPTYLYLQWTDFIIKEFFRQGDMEKEFKLPVSPLMDREKSVISKGQLAFQEYVLLPMFKSFASVFKKFDFAIQLILKNKEYWKKNTTIRKDCFGPTKDQRKLVTKFVE